MVETVEDDWEWLYGSTDYIRLRIRIRPSLANSSSGDQGYSVSMIPVLADSGSRFFHSIPFHALHVIVD